MQAFVLLCGLILSASALAQNHTFVAAVLVLWTVVLSYVLRRAQSWSDD
jgi:hypothetical protein